MGRFSESGPSVPLNQPLVVSVTEPMQISAESVEGFSSALVAAIQFERCVLRWLSAREAGALTKPSRDRSFYHHFAAIRHPCLSFDSSER